MPARGQRCSDEAKAKIRAAAQRRDISGSRNPNWKGGRVRAHDGRVYRYAPGHPGANIYKGSHILEYRLIAEQIVGRPLRSDEIVHHKNGDPSDNRVENLEVMSQAEHARIHASERRDPLTGRFLPGSAA